MLKRRSQVLRREAEARMFCPSCTAENGDDRYVCASCGQVLKTGTLPEGYLIAGRYEIKRFLGAGGMGTVYETWDRSLEEGVALKLLKPDFSRDPDMSRRFRQEIKLARRLR